MLEDSKQRELKAMEDKMKNLQQRHEAKLSEISRKEKQLLDKQAAKQADRVQQLNSSCSYLHRWRWA